MDGIDGVDDENTCKFLLAGEAPYRIIQTLKGEELQVLQSNNGKEQTTKIHESGNLNVITLISGMINRFESCNNHG